jgi:hypothetical protein
LPQANNLRATITHDERGTLPVTYYYSSDGINREYPVTFPTFDISGSIERTVYVIADNSAGSVVSVGVTGMPYITGSKPTVNIVSGVNKIIVSFSQSTAGTSPVTYYYSYSSNGSNRIGPVTSPFEITNILTAKTIYVIANNIVGNVISDAATGTPYVIGSAPVILSVSPGINSIIVDFSGSTGGYPAPSAYYYSVDGGNYVLADNTSSPMTIPDLMVAKQYTVTIIAQNAAGFTSPSNLVSGSPINQQPPVIIVNKDPTSDSGGSYAMDRKTAVNYSRVFSDNPLVRAQKIYVGGSGKQSGEDVVTRKRRIAILRSSIPKPLT